MFRRNTILNSNSLQVRKMADAKKRADFKRCIDRMSACISGPEYDQAPIEDIEVRMTRLESAMNSFDEEHQGIVAATLETDNDAIQLNEDIIAQTEDAYYKIKANFARKINNLKNPPTVETTPTPPASPALDGNGNLAENPTTIQPRDENNHIPAESTNSQTTSQSNLGTSSSCNARFGPEVDVIDPKYLRNSVSAEVRGNSIQEMTDLP